MMTNENGKHDERAGEFKRFAQRTLAAVCITAFVLLLLLLCWYAIDALLLAFAGVLLAIFLRGLSDELSKRTPLSGGWSLAVVLLALLIILGAFVWLRAASIAEQIAVMRESLPQSIEHAKEYVSRYDWGRRLLAQLPSSGKLLSNRTNILGRVTGIFSTTLGFVTNLIIILFVGFYLAVEPSLYTNGIIRLVPVERRSRAREVLQTLGQTLRRWLIGRVLLMIVNGGLTTLGLWLLGVPLVLTLGILAGLLNFVPNVGPVIAGVPAVLLALMQSPAQALYVFALYLVLQSADGYIFTPLVQRRTVSLPPALTIMAQVILGVLMGGLGLVLATPLAATAFLLVRMLYVEDTLGAAVMQKNDKRAHAR